MSVPMQWQFQYNAVRAPVETGEAFKGIFEKLHHALPSLHQRREAFHSQVIYQVPLPELPVTYSSSRRSRRSQPLSIFVNYLAPCLFICLVTFALQTQGTEFTTCGEAVRPQLASSSAGWAQQAPRGQEHGDSGTVALNEKINFFCGTLFTCWIHWLIPLFLF